MEDKTGKDKISPLGGLHNEPNTDDALEKDQRNIAEHILNMISKQLRSWAFLLF